MNTLVKRIVVVLAATVLAGAATVTPASADANYTCTSGTRFLMSDLLGYYIIASGCTGSGTGTYGTITIPAGSYFCQNVNHLPSPDIVSGQNC
ncbi:hypothetical protein ACIBEJ_08390 [Nonomuraea sp. NPDC050790]|uniref:hypothetical protein n=1 Tax=Nonomuraea sp. NPDC050790 TaxID=3364371 RepID=UPI0037AE05F9